MTSQITAKIRLVKCPRCRRVLPELSNVPVYQCGGCNAVLQVKKRKNGTNDSELPIRETDISQKKEVQHDSEDKGTREGTIKEETSVDKIIETGHEETKISDNHQSENTNCFSSGRESFEAATGEADDNESLLKNINRNGSEEFNSPDEVDSLTDFGHHENKELSPTSIAPCESQEKSRQNEELSPGDETHDEGAEKGKGLEKSNGSGRVSPSNELSCHEIEDLSPETGTSNEFDADAISHYIFGNLKKGKFSAMDPGDSFVTPQRLSRESTLTGSLSPPHIEKLELSQLREDTEVEPVTSKETLEDKESPVFRSSCNQVLPPNELSCQEIDDSSPVVGTRTELKENSISRFIFGNLKKENLLDESLGVSVVNTPRLSGERRLEENPISPLNENVEQPQLREPSRFDSVSSEETTENIAFINTDSKHRSSHAYDGGESSFGETDDQDPDQYVRLLKGKSIEVESLQVSALPTSSYPDSFSRERKTYATKEFAHRQDQLREVTRHGRPVRSKMRFQSDERLSRAHFHSRVSPMGYEYGSSSNPVPNYGKNFNFHPKPDIRYEEKLKLKKLILELQDRLNRSHTPKGGARGGLKHVPPCKHVSMEVDMCRDLCHNGCPCGCYHREAFPNQCKVSRIPFSAEAAINRPQMGHSCLQCAPRDWHCSAPFSPHLYYKPCQCTALSSCNHHNVHCCRSDFPLKSCEMMCSDDWAKHRKEKIYKERNHALRRHVLPVKGGAPFVVCDNCSKLLQLPGDFLLFRKRYHQLRCSSCSYVLKFSLRNGYRLDRYVDDESGDLAPAPPPSEVGDLRDVSKGKKMSYGSSCPHVDPVCISDDYGLSICKSCSTETEPVSGVLPYNIHERDSNCKKTISGTSVDHQNRRKNLSILKESQNVHEDRISKAEKSSPVIKRLQGRDVSPLHRLMGYNSAREVLNG